MRMTRNYDGTRGSRLIKRLGVAGFMFFLLKGLAWLVAPLLIAGYAAL